MDLRQYNDSELVELLKRDKSVKDLAFKEIYNRYSKLIHALIACIVRDKDVVSDLFQDTFMKFYNNVNAREDVSNIAGYLTIIARNSSLNYMRNKKQKVEIDENILYYDERNNVENKELIELIINAVELLDEPYRDAFIMREIDGMNYTQIACRLNITYENAKARAVRAKQKLIKILDPYLQDLKK